LKIYDKIFATLRFDMWEKLEAHMKKLEEKEINKGK
jgi:hypothetical protein